MKEVGQHEISDVANWLQSRRIVRSVLLARTTLSPPEKAPLPRQAEAHLRAIAPQLVSREALVDWRERMERSRLAVYGRHAELDEKGKQGAGALGGDALEVVARATEVIARHFGCKGGGGRREKAAPLFDPRPKLPRDIKY